jgi:uncharacterized protein (DUF885 family)
MSWQYFCVVAIKKDGTRWIVDEGIETRKWADQIARDFAAEDTDPDVTYRVEKQEP